MEEFNNRREELPQKKEFGKKPEYGRPREAGPKPQEKKEFEERGQKSKTGTKKKKPENNSIFKVLQSFVIVSLFAVSIGTLPLLPQNTPKASIDYIEYSDVAAYYRVIIEEDSKSKFKVVIYNDYYKSENFIEAGEFEGVAEGLKPSTKYTLAVKSNSGYGYKTLIKESFTTMEEILPPVSKVEGIEIEKKLEENKINFRLNYVDENGYWMGFSAKLTVNGDTVQIFDMNDNPSGWYTIDTYYMDSRDYLLTIEVLSYKPEDMVDNEPMQIVLAETVINIL